ncbi:hypothetical protein [Tenacibaculum caenipelagi]|uniref:Uncharacterized protein n=1 Tax=Tenacibaculum caenipelagi TaxID=1325435 RepID=A0A4R6TG43_9FLAO|nr:hypothetical protein [Tenacibaculum caenipelagi]TDQ27649.1 hypothetical protein DFQ07_1500 [Tenacibaculum caenipelagi]
MTQIRQIEVGERIECVYKHKSSKKKITIGNTYEVVKVRKYTNDIISGYYIINDDGKREYHDKHTQSFKKITDIYTTEELNLLKRLQRNLLCVLSLHSIDLSGLNEEALEEFIHKTSKEYIKKIKLKDYN